jgi:hypothetical protein
VIGEWLRGAVIEIAESAGKMGRKGVGTFLIAWVVEVGFNENPVEPEFGNTQLPQGKLS